MTKMKSVFALSLAACLGFAFLPGCVWGGDAAGRSLLSRTFDVFRGSPERREAARYRHLVMEMEVQPLPLRLPEARRMDVTVTIENKGKRLVQLQFPSSQRIEVLVRDEAGRKIVTWSDDQMFTQAVSYLAINPGERVEHAFKIPTRDMTAGRQYVVEAFVPGYESLVSRREVVPVP